MVGKSTLKVDWSGGRGLFYLFINLPIYFFFVAVAY